MAHFCRLKFLDLSFNNFAGAIPSWFGFLRRLQVINISNDSYTGSIPSSFSNISTVETLNLDFNSVEGQIPKVIGSLINLRELNLRGNMFIGSITLSLSNASRLETLDITFNSLQGNIPKGIDNLHNLKLLGIQDNQLMAYQDIFPTVYAMVYQYSKSFIYHNLSHCSQLRILGLSDNEFYGPIHSEIGRLTNLQVLALGTNHFTGTFHLMNTRTNVSYYLRILFYYTLIAGIIPQEIGNIVNLVKLGIEENQITGSVPISLFHISSLQLLSLAQNNLSETSKEISNLVELEKLDLAANSFSGSVDMEIFNISGLIIIDISFNNLSGSLLPNIGSILPNIEEIYLGSLTNLVWTIPHSISNCSKLTTLELADNKLNGLIPNSLGYLTHLQLLNLRGNNLTRDSSLSFLTSLTNCRKLTFLYIYLNPLNGMLPTSTGNLSTSLRTLVSNSCKIQGRIPNEVGNLSILLFLSLSRNNLVGSITTSIGNMKTIQRFELTNNKLTGFIGEHIGRYIWAPINCSSNIPPSIGNLQDLVVLDLSSNNTIGSLPQEIGNLKSVTKIDISMNEFPNEIPREIKGLQNLAHLSLRHNKLQGSILDSVSNMVGLEFLDLSHNDISGIITKSLEKLQNMKHFNVSANKLYRQIPSRGPFKSLSSQFFIYNKELCGSSRFSVPPCPTSSKHKSNRKKFLVLHLLMGITLLFSPIILVCVWIRYRRRKRAPQQDDSLASITRERISYYELRQATDALSQSNLIRFWKFWLCLQGILKSGTVVAVKVFNLKLNAAFNSFDTECEVLCSLLHRNLVKLITSCSNLDFKALILEYMPSGSLEKYLYSHNYFLDTR
ncbi:hypothetical protein P3L10_013970 [Capsicum annuum]